jgi:hypothetical protein
MKLSTTLLAVAVALCVSATALAYPTHREPPAGSNAPAMQDLRMPDRVAPAPPPPRQDLRSPDRIQSVAPALPNAAAGPSHAVSIRSDGGLGAVSIALISLGAALLVATLAYAAMRTLRAHGHRHAIG